MIVEPHADLRQLANFQHQYFVAMTNEGFIEAQALTILGHPTAAMALNNKKDEK